MELPTPEDLKRWSWEPHGDGWALYQGRTGMTHGMNKLWVPNDGGFDWGGAEMRERIARLLNESEGIHDEDKSSNI